MRGGASRIRRSRAWAARLSVLLLFVASHAQAEDDGIVVATVLLDPAPYTVTLPDKVGVLGAATRLDLSFEVSGRVELILQEGTRVAPGDVVAQLDAALEQAELRRSSLLLEDALSELRRVQGLQRSSAASDSALEAARTAVGLRRAERDAARERLDRRQLRARFAGVVAEVDIEPGEVTVPGRPVARLIDFEVMKLEVGVPGRQIGRVERGALVELAVPALPGEHFEGRVLHVAPSAANGGALFEVDIRVPNGDGRLKPGMSARASIVTEVVADALAVPVQTSVLRERVRVIFVVEDGRAHSVDVSEALLHGDMLVLRDVPRSVVLVVRGQHDLRDGAPVHVDDAVLEAGDASVGAQRVGVVGR
jgi:membrane fusion protein (multidrug efflux system)